MRCLGQTSNGHDDHDDHHGYEENKAVRGYTSPYEELRHNFVIIFYVNLIKLIKRMCQLNIFLFSHPLKTKIPIKVARPRAE